MRNRHIKTVFGNCRGNKCIAKWNERIIAKTVYLPQYAIIFIFYIILSSYLIQYSTTAYTVIAKNVIHLHLLTANGCLTFTVHFFLTFSPTEAGLFLFMEVGSIRIMHVSLQFVTFSSFTLIIIYFVKVKTKPRGIYHTWYQWRTQDFFKGGGFQIGPKISQRLSQPLNKRGGGGGGGGKRTLFFFFLV